jgi:hypothetical protein
MLVRKPGAERLFPELSSFSSRSAIRPSQESPPARVWQPAIFRQTARGHLSHGDVRMGKASPRSDFERAEHSFGRDGRPKITPFKMKKRLFDDGKTLKKAIGTCEKLFIAPSRHWTASSKHRIADIEDIVGATIKRDAFFKDIDTSPMNERTSDSSKDSPLINWNASPTNRNLTPIDKGASPIHEGASPTRKIA